MPQSTSNLIQTVTGGKSHVTNTWATDRDILELKENKIFSYNFSSYDYSMNALGQRTGVDTSGDAFWGSERDRTWGYDLMGQLTVENDLVNNAYDRGFAFDRVGNRTASIAGSTNPAGVGAITYTPNALNQYSAIFDPASAITTPQYDDDGNTTSSSIRPTGLPGSSHQVAGYVWDAENRLIEIRQPNNTLIASYKYDAFGRRIATTRPSYPSLVFWIYDGWNPITKYYGIYGPSEIYLWGLDVSGTLQGAGGVGGLLSFSFPGLDTFYPTYDGNGNVSECIATNYGIDVHYEYDAFGNVINTSGWFSQYFPFRFSTKQQDDESGLLYYGYRYYDPLTGRWPSRDPVGEWGGVNLYGFVGNDAILLHDYLGMWDRERVILIMCQSQSGANIVDKLNKVVVKKSEFSRSYRRNVGSSDWEVYNWGALTTTGKDGKKTIHVPKDSSDEEAAVTLAHESAHADGSEKGDTPWQKSEIDAYARETRFAISVGIKPNEKFVDKYDATRVNIFGIEDFVNQAYKGYYEGSNDVEFKKDDSGAIIYEFGNESDETPWKCAECMPPTSP